MIPWLDIRNLEFSRNERTILESISLGIFPGDLTLLTGHNGSGKTTLLRIMAGLLQPDAGLFSLEGKTQSNWRRSRNLLRKNVCYLHQRPYLFDGSVFDNVSYGLRRRKIDKRRIQSLVMDALANASLEHLSGRNSRELSGGEQQRVAIVRAQVLNPRLMLLDEPLANMDKQSRRQCLAMINQLHREQVSVIFTSHDPQQGELNISRHLHLYQGTLSLKKPHPV
jgi:energy-coupling factor transporter ATP-binding protein EcfA2